MSNFALPMELPNFRAALRDTNSDFALSRLTACIALSLADDSEVAEAVQQLVRLLKDPVGEVRAQAVESLAVHLERGCGQVPVDAALLMDDPFPAVRCAVVAHMYLFLDMPLSYALDAASDEHEDVRAAATVLLARVDEPLARLRLHEMLEDKNEDVRAIAALHQPAPLSETAMQILLSFVQKRNEYAQDALGVLAHDAHPAAIEAILHAATGRFVPFELKAMAAAAYTHFQSDDPLAPARRLLSSRRKSRRLAVLQAFCSIPHTHATPLLLQCIGTVRCEEELCVALQALRMIFSDTAALQKKLQSIQGKVHPKVAHEFSEFVRELEHHIE